MTADLRKMAVAYLDGIPHDGYAIDTLVAMLARVRSEALDEAAKECEKLESYKGDAATFCASRIRALDPKGAAGR